MATIKAEYYRLNGDTWDKYYFKTTADMVEGLSKNKALISDGSGKVAISPVTSTQLGFLSDVTSNIQAQLNGKVTSSYVDGKTDLKSNTDNRTVNTTPNDYNAKFDIKGLKANATLGISGQGTYSALLGIRGWTDSSGGNSHEFALTGDGEIYHRHGATTTWNAWNVLAKQSWVTANTRSNTWTPSWGQVSGKPTWIGSSKPTYDLSEIADTTTYKRVTATEKSTWGNKQNAITGGATTITSNNLSKNKALISDGSGKVAISPVTSVQLGFLSDVTSNIQAQLNSKMSSSGSYNDLTNKLTAGDNITIDSNNKISANVSGTWKQIYSGTSSALSKTSTTSITVPSDVYPGKAVAIEIRYGNNNASVSTNKIVFVTLGYSTSYGSSKTNPNFVSFSDFDGQYLKNISTMCYVNTGTTSTIYFGYLRTLIGSFSGSNIDWTTQASDSISVYIGKIWVLE